MLLMNNALNSKDYIEEGEGKVVGSLGVGTTVIFKVPSSPNHSMISSSSLNDEGRAAT